MKKIAFIGHDLKFIDHIIEYFEKNFDYEIRIDEWTGHESHNEQKSLEIVEWADVLFCEWGLGNVVWYQEHKKEHQKLIVRLHRFEMDTKYIKMFDYNKIDLCIAISPYIYEEFHRIAKVPREKMKVIYNAIDTQRFDKPKKRGYEFHIGIIGIVPKLKRLDRAIDILEELYKKDKRYKLFIKGKHPNEYNWVWNNPEQRKFYDVIFERIQNADFKDNIIFEGWGDVSEWLQNIGYILSVSDYESFHMAPIEGMASGAVPLVLQREGVNTVFPNGFIQKNKQGIVDTIVNQKFEIVDLKSYPISNFDIHIIGEQINKLFI